MPPELPPLHAFDLSTYIWSDDGGNAALHYLALGRRASPYTGVNLHVATLPRENAHAATTLATRCKLVALLTQHGRISPDTFTILNAAGASALHFAAAHGELPMVQTLLQSAGEAVEFARLQPDRLDMLPVDLALLHGHVRCGRELGLLLLSNANATAARCAAILALHDSVAPEADGEWAANLELDEIRVHVQSTDSQRITLIHDRQRELADSLGMPLVRCRRRPPRPRPPRPHAARAPPQPEAAELLLQSGFDVERAREAHAQARRAG